MEPSDGRAAIAASSVVAGSNWTSRSIFMAMPMNSRRLAADTVRTGVGKAKSGRLSRDDEVHGNARAS
jgi:hypothetical protein